MVQVNLGTNILGANDLLARQNRNLFASKGVLVLNLMSSPGSGKTTILEKTLEELQGKVRLGVIEGDLYTDRDAKRIENKGAPVIQINTQGGCHLDADMVAKSYQNIDAELDVVVIENVGNLVCPAEFDLGEDLRVVVLSTTEGNDKPVKYPLAFRQAQVIIVNKMDLLPYTDFNTNRLSHDLLDLNPTAQVFFVSGRTGEGIDEWCEWLLEAVENKKAQHNDHGQE